MAQTSSKITIGIIGSDSSHTIAFLNEFRKNDRFEVQWIDINNRTNLQFSKERSVDIIKNLQDEEIELINDLSNAKEVDAYCILSLDANSHVEVLQILKDRGKPIFIDKPIFYDLDHFEDLPEMVFSSSALRYTDFMRDAKLNSQNNNDDIHIEGPLSFIYGIGGYFWYGIHLVEMLHTLCNEEVVINNCNKHLNYELISGTCGLRNFTIKGITVGNPEFKVIMGSKTYSIINDSKNIYENLVLEIMNFFETKISKTNGKEIIKTVLNINEMRR